MKGRYWLLLLFSILGTLNLVACEREGPLERAGEKADEAGREVQDTTQGDHD